MTTTTDLATASARDIAALVTARTASPVEVMQATLARIARLNPGINGFQILLAEDAMAAARAAEAAVMRGDPLGPLHGVPATIKDVQAVAGTPTRKGSPLTDATPDTQDAPLVARLRAAGAIILGKTTLPDRGWMAYSDSPLSGPTHNPWKRGYTAGGSSSGAAALCAAGIAPLHLGTDGAGSVRLPAHFCGVVGLKPTFGRVPYPPVAGHMLSHAGPITRSAEDAALMLQVMSGPSAEDATSLPQPFDAATMLPSVKGMRIAYSPDLGHARVDPEVASLVADAVRAFEAMGAVVEQVTPPWGPKAPEIGRAIWTLLAMPMLPPADQEHLLDPGLLAWIRASRMEGAESVPWQSRRFEFAAEVARWFADYDLLLTPSASVAAFPLGHVCPPHWPQHAFDWVSWAEFSHPFNLAHNPAVSVPCGLTQAGLPVGLQIAAPRFEDARVLGAAAAFLQARPFAIRPAQ